jgi:hypothetical protein
MPIETIALNDDGKVFQLEINHKLSQHDYLLLKSNTSLREGLCHCDLNVSALPACQLRKDAKQPVFFATVFAASFTAWIGFKRLAAVIAEHYKLRFPLSIVTAHANKLSGGVKAFQRAIDLLIVGRTILAPRKFLTTLNTNACNGHKKVSYRATVGTFA